MRKKWVAALLVLVALGIVLATIYFWRPTSEEPKLEVVFNPPSRTVYAGGKFELNITIINEGNSSAKNVNITLTMPEEFTISQSGANNYSRVFPHLEVGRKENVTLSLTVSQTALPKKYYLDVKISAENLSTPLSRKYEVEVRLPVS